MIRRAVVITVSDRSARGERVDASGPVAIEALRDAGWTATGITVPDGIEPVGAAIDAALGTGARLVVTTGGTGIGPRDETPEATAPRLAIALPGIAEELRRRGATVRATATLSRGVAGIAVGSEGPALVVNLPGSPGGVADGIALILEIADHAIAQVDGGDHP
jgi:molybdenum cofactor synthesis domain-containing protein